MLLPAVRCRPLDCPALAPLIAMIGVPLKPGCVVPSITTGSLMIGREDVGAIVMIPSLLGGILKVMVCVPEALLESMIACRNEPAPLSFVLVTVKVVAVVTAVGCVAELLTVSRVSDAVPVTVAVLVIPPAV